MLARRKLRPVRFVNALFNSRFNQMQPQVTPQHRHNLAEAAKRRHAKARAAEAECASLRAEVARLREVNREQAADLRDMRTEVAAVRATLNRLGVR
ncbi:hypothetical protein CNY89_08860 [Amaricoccus sp. HAR-UPW-R2A-40]|nr:hypothetical protein CNY89_08860 [Amaricoccus sp. HAR-UPW-R2A-40]